MGILHKPTATVGQIVKDLELIVAKSPDIFMEYRDDDYNAKYVKGIKLRKDIAIFETTWKRYRAATLEEILAMLKMLDASVRVVMQAGWELLDFHPNADDSILQYDDEEDYCLFLLDRNVQLLTTQEMEAELKEKYGEEVLSYKVAMVDKKLIKACLMNSLQWIEGKLCLCHDEDEEKDSITVAELLDEFPTCAEFMVVICRGTILSKSVREASSLTSRRMMRNTSVYSLARCCMTRKKNWKCKSNKNNYE